MKAIGKRRTLRAVPAVLLLISLIMPAAAGGTEKPDYYGIGLETVAVLDEMMNSSDYLDMILPGESYRNAIDTTFNTGDYDAPVSVYRLTREDPWEWIKTRITEAEREKLEALSPALQEQVRLRISGSGYLFNQINARKGTEALAVSSALQAVQDRPELEIEETVYYLFIFRQGVPVLVTYSRHCASGMFAALEKEETESPEALQAFLKDFGLEATPVEIPRAE